MLKHISWALTLALLLTTLALPALAAQGGGGGIHFGPYTLAEGDSATGDLLVFGPVKLGEDSSLDGDLVVFGAATLEEGATVTGDLAVFGAADISGKVEGDVFSAGEMQLEETAHIEGDVAVMGNLSRDEGAFVGGEITSGEGTAGFSWNFPIVGPVTLTAPTTRPVWVQLLLDLLRGFVAIVALGLFALLIAGVWPVQLERAGRVLTEEPLPTFGVGLLVLLAAGFIILLLSLTVCLTPFALLIATIVGVGMVLGWVALGDVLGRRILVGLFKQRQVTAIGSTVLGTVLITTLAALVSLVPDCLFILLIFPLLALAAGAVTLTRFGTMPYATRGGSLPGQPAPPILPQELRSSEPTAPPAPVEPEQVTGEEQEE
ncbi:MAG: polymer-forming cytoskeletal protein [Anaerolineae bacterium]|nr:polymer-forming cytoskeletal protein [Anaerolineae bacterium]